MVQILRFTPLLQRSADWTPREIAEFYRVESALTQAGVALEIERGLTDEGDPWFVFCRRDTGEVFVHFARIDGEYIIDGAGFFGVARGRDFSALVRALISGETLHLAKLRPANSNVLLHPAALLIALVGASFFHSGEAKAAEVVGHKGEARRAPGSLLVLTHRSSAPAPLGLDAAQAAVVMAGVLIGIDEQRALPAPGLLLVSDAAPAAATAPPPAVEATASFSARSAPAAPSAPQVSEAQPFVAHTVVAPAGPVPPSSMADSDLAKLAGLMLAAAPPSVAVAAFAAGSAPPPVMDRPYFIASDGNLLPVDEAGQVVRDLSAGGDPHPISLADKLPALMEDLIQHGSRVSSTPQTAAPSAAAPTAAEPAAGATASPPPAAVATAPSLPSPHDPAIDQAVTSFMAAVNHWGVVVNGEELVIYDANIFGPHSGALDSVTFTFADGSSISLVGTAAELSSAHVLH